ncbi:MAG: hypothetical protein D6723_09610, partial [Acidobacteria bacterium]
HHRRGGRTDGTIHRPDEIRIERPYHHGPDRGPSFHSHGQSSAGQRAVSRLRLRETINLDVPIDIDLLRVDSGGNFYIVTHTDEASSQLNTFAPSGQHVLTCDLQGTPHRLSIHDLFITPGNKMCSLPD